MVQFAKTAAQKEKEKGGPKKPKKELGGIMDIVQVALPLLASVTGTPMAGAAVSALLEGAESKLEGGSWKEALTKSLVSGGIGAATGGLASGTDKLAGEAFKKTAEEGSKIGTKAVAEATKGAAGSFLQPSATVAAGGFKNIAGKTGDELTKGLAGSLTPEAGKTFTQHLATGTRDAAIDSMIAGGQPGDATAKAKFIDHVTELGTMGLETHGAMQAEAGARRGQAEAINAQSMANRQAVMGGERHKRSRQRYSGYGGY